MCELRKSNHTNTLAHWIHVRKPNVRIVHHPLATLSLVCLIQSPRLNTFSAAAVNRFIPLRERKGNPSSSSSSLFSSPMKFKINELCVCTERTRRNLKMENGSYYHSGKKAEAPLVACLPWNNLMCN